MHKVAEDWFILNQDDPKTVIPNKVSSLKTTEPYIKTGNSVRKTKGRRIYDKATGKSGETNRMTLKHSGNQLSESFRGFDLAHESSRKMHEDRPHHFQLVEHNRPIEAIQ